MSLSPSTTAQSSPQQQALTKYKLADVVDLVRSSETARSHLGNALPTTLLYQGQQANISIMPPAWPQARGGQLNPERLDKVIMVSYWEVA